MLTGNIFITGGSGFLARGIMRRAQRDNWNCRFTCYSRNEELQQRAKAKYAAHYVLGDIVDFDRLKLAMIGHDTVIGKNCLFAAQVGIAGATTIGNGVILWGQVGVSKTLTIGDNTTIYAQSGVKDSLKGNNIYFGSPVEPAKEKMKEFVWIKRIPELWKKVMGDEGK